MSRAREIAGKWFDVHRNGQPATEEQLELLSTVEDLDLDDLLDEVLTQGEVVQRLRERLGQGIPPQVLEKRQRWREERKGEPECRICGRKGDSTKHHFVSRWILKELEGYHRLWADRSVNTIPACIHCHRDLHSRDNGPHSIAGYLDEEEMEFAENALTALAEERPKLLILIARGSNETYETRLIRDWFEGKFRGRD